MVLAGQDAGQAPVGKGTIQDASLTLTGVAGEGVDLVEAYANGTESTVREALGDELPPGGGGGGEPRPGEGGNSSSPPKEAGQANKTKAGVEERLIMLNLTGRDGQSKPGDQAAAEASGAFAFVLGAFEVIRVALAGLFGDESGSSGSGGLMGVASAAVTRITEHPVEFFWVWAATTGLLAGLVYFVRRIVPFTLVPLLSRIAKSELYENDARRLVAELVEREPGLCLHDLVGRTQYSRNAVSYHLFVLEKENLVVSVRDGKYRRYFTRNGKYVNGAKDVVSVLRNDVSLRIAQFIRDNPGSIQRDVCQRLETTPSAACWHAKRLEQSGVLRKERAANTVRYFLGPAVEKYDLAEFGLRA